MSIPEFAYQQCSRVKAGLVLCAFKVCAPELVDCSVIPPDKSAEGEFDKVGEKNVSPELAPADVLWCKLHEGSNVAVLVIGLAASDYAHGDQNGAAKHAEHSKYIPNHPQKPHEQDSVQPDLVHELLLFRLCDGLDPVEWTIGQRLRSVLFVGMFGSWCVHATVLWSEEAKDEEQKAGDDEGIDDCGVNGALLDLCVSR